MAVSDRQRRHRSEREDVTGERAGNTPSQWTWHSLREYMVSKYRGSYAEQELRTMELKWRRIFADAGWSVKGQ